jgi:hypothetical protein
MRFRIASAVLVLATLLSLAVPKTAPAVTLIGDPFVSPYSGWVDPDRTLGGTWRLNLHTPTPTLMDVMNSNPSAIVSPPNNSGTYLPHLLIQDNVLTGANYEYTASMRTNDDDILGIVFNYQDPSNYFRAGIRQQASGTFGGTQGFSVQKIVGGTITQIFPATNVAGPAPITQAMVDARTSFDLKVVVNAGAFNVFFNGTSQLPGGTAIADADLASDRKVGFQSWAQLYDVETTIPHWGTEVNSVSVVDGANSLLNHNFGGALPVKWRNLVMKNGANISMPSLGSPLGGTTHTASREDMGSFGLDINDRWIMQQTNGFENATTTVNGGGGNVDFISPAVVVDDPGSANLSDYTMQVRIAADDNDGMGVLVRVQNDNTFYRVNFAAQGMGTGTTRSPQGLSVQKNLNGVWSELFRDNQVTPAFVPAVGVEPADTTIPFDWPFSAGLKDINGNNMYFDLRVSAVGNSLFIEVTDHLGNVISYPVITDSNNPLLTGTVGLTTWGNGGTYYMNYGGVDGTPLVVDPVPEPSTVALVIVATVGMFSIRRRFAKA